MIAWLSGIVRHLETHNVILDVNGVGYDVAITARTRDLLGAVGNQAMLHIVTVVREDAINLIGFALREEKDAFVKLTTVQGVGAKMALSLLSSLAPEQVWRAILADDKKSLTAADGVGPKLAVRLTTELKDFASKQVFPGTATKSHGVQMSRSAAVIATPTQEAVSALINLGYSPVDATRAVSLVANENEDADLATLIRLSLREVSA